MIGSARVWPCVTRWFGRWRKRSSHIGHGDALKVRAKRLVGGRDGAVRHRVDEVLASSRDREEAGKSGGMRRGGGRRRAWCALGAAIEWRGIGAGSVRDGYEIGARSASGRV
ncbi:hypothetical protein PT2222_190025 [Paraburkholderia tropica]